MGLGVLGQSCRTGGTGWDVAAGAHLPHGCHGRGSVPKEPHVGDTAQPQRPQLPPYSSAINVYDSRERE